MQVRNKQESIEIIKEKKLNSFPEKLFHQNQEKEILAFLNEYPAKYYAIRSKDIIGYKHNNYKVLKEDVLKEAKKFNIFTINVSSYNYSKNLILIGNVMIGHNNEVWLTCSTNQNYTGRMAEEFPDFNISTNIFDNKLNDIPSFDLLYKYIVEHDLIDIIVEFAIYDCPLGIYNEPIIVFEIRTEF